MLNPLVGETKGDDVDAVTRMRTYQALIDNKALGEGDKDEELWKKAGCDITDRIILLGLDIKMFYGGPKEAIMHAIYRQNFGFTDIVIGRKHADAPYDDGKDIWDGLAAQRKFDELKGELLIQAGQGRLRGVLRGAGPGRAGRRVCAQGLQAGVDQRPRSAREAARRRAARSARHAAGDGANLDREHEGEVRAEGRSWPKCRVI